MILLIPMLILTAATLPSPADRTPVVLELFTSEGCSSCPPADRLLEQLDREQPARGADLIVISEHVDYWNYLGWSDPYSLSEFGSRQREYARRLKTGEVYTPQLVVDGVDAFVGSDRALANRAIQRATEKPKKRLSFEAVRGADAETVRITEPATAGVEYFVMLASDHATSDVIRGENSGTRLSHVAVAYALTRLGVNRSVRIPVKPGETRVIAFGQESRTGRIVAANQLRN